MCVCVHKKIRIVQIKHTMFTRNCIWIYFIRSLKPLIKADHKLFGSFDFSYRNNGNKILGCVTSLDNPTSASSSDHWYPKQMIHSTILVINGHRYVCCCKETLSLLWLLKLKFPYDDEIKLNYVGNNNETAAVCFDSERIRICSSTPLFSSKKDPINYHHITYFHQSG